MRLMIRFSFPTEHGNELVTSGKVGQIVQGLMEDFKPEAAYFFPENGQRGGFFIVNSNNTSDLAKIAESFWLGLHANVSVTPVMNGEDLKKGLTDFGAIAKRYT